VPTIFQSSGKNATAAKTAMPPVHTTLGPLTSYALRPDNVRFETQEAQEAVVLFLRQHIIVNVPWIILAVLMIFAPTVIFPLLLHVVGVTIHVPMGYIIIATIWWYVATFGFIVAKFFGWFINIYIVTNERVVDIDFYYLLYKHFSEAELNKIQDISYTSQGIFAAVFNYGNVTIETAGEAPNLVFEMVPYPEHVVETIRSLMGGHGGEAL
jgi:uncharacterized membrane protein YdbT with pleckstrin-like domain